MKKIIYTLIAIFLSTSFFAQEGFNYKTIIKNNGVILSNQTLDIRFTIYSTDPNDGGTQLYQETHTTTTNANGIAIVKMGEGTTMDFWDDIFWDADNYYKTEYNIGSGYVDMGTQRFDLVPAAKFANRTIYADSAYQAYYADHVIFRNIEYKPTTLAGYGITDADPSTTNELQNLSVTGDQLSISSGNTVTLPTGTTYTAGTGIGISGGVISNTGDTDNNNSNELQTISQSGNTVTLSNGGGSVTITEADGSATNELQNLSITGDQLSISSGNTVTLPTGTTYTAGTGIGISGGVISNTGDTDAADDFDGNYYSLSNTPIQFLDAGGDDPTSISTDVHRMSGVALGNNQVQKGKLDIRVTGANTTIPENVGLGIVNSSTTATALKGVDVALTGNSSGAQYGIYNTINNSGGAAHSGVYNLLRGASIGEQYGIKNYIDNTGGGFHYGVLNELTGAGTGTQYGMSNEIDNSGNGYHYAVRNDMTGTGSGVHAAMFNTLSGSGSGFQYGVKSEITNTSTGQHYGFNAILSGSGNGNKYGSYNFIDPSAGGTHYAVYGSATKLGSYAGYFEGDVKVTKKVMSVDSGDADMKAYIYGKIDTSTTGAIVTIASSDGFSIVRNDTGDYTVHFVNPPGTTLAYTVIASMDNENIGFISVKNYNSYFKVYTYSTDEAGIKNDRDFTFVVYKK